MKIAFLVFISLKFVEVNSRLVDYVMNFFEPMNQKHTSDAINFTTK